MERSFPNLNGDTSFVKIRRELELQRSFEVHQVKEKRSFFRAICGRGPASGKEQPFPVVMVTRIALDSMDEVTRKKKPFHSRKNELHSCSTDRERSRFVLESRQLAYLHVLPCISDVWRAFSPRFSRLDAQWIDLCIDVFIVAIGCVVAEILPFQSETIAKVGVYQ